MHIKTFWQNRKSWQKGLLISSALLFLNFLYLFVSLSLGYDGKCGGLLPFLAGSHECSFFEYLQQAFSFSFIIILVEFWWIIIPVIILPILIGWLIDRVQKRKLPPA